MIRRALRSPHVQLLFGLTLVALGVGLRTTPTRVATFNLENFRDEDSRVTSLLEEIADTEAAIVAVQEVGATRDFAAAARAHLGAEWHFVHTDAGHPQRVGVLFDTSRVQLLEPARTIEAPLIGDRAKAALHARFEVEGSDRPVRVIVVHLTSGRARSALRARQLDALEPWIAGAVASGEQALVLGDFNAVTEADAARIAALAEHLDLEWTTRGIPCSTYWQRESTCEAATLDHVLATDAEDARMHGGCARDGCGPMERCPLYRREVSDHCPLSVALR